MRSDYGTILPGVRLLSRRKPLRFDGHVARFRDALGRFTSKKRGIASSAARESYLFAIAAVPALESKVKKPTPRPKVKKPTPRPKVTKVAPRRGAKRRPPRFVTSLVSAHPGQTAAYLLDTHTRPELAAILWAQIKAGAQQFRFWYKMPAITAYSNAVGSTMNLHVSVLTLLRTYRQVLNFVMGRTGHIQGPVIYYWFK